MVADQGLRIADGTTPTGEVGMIDWDWIGADILVMNIDAGSLLAFAES
jgi:hypothetical protein